LIDLRLSMFMGGDSGPKLKAKAAEARLLVPFAVEACEKMLDDTNPIHRAVKHAAKELNACYQCLAGASFSVESIRDHCRRFCLLMVSLETITGGKDSLDWRVKPKLHLFQELCEFLETNPSMTWCYRDEDFGGTLAALAHSRGGKNSVISTSTSLLQRFMANNPVPTFD
jgi:hypothetical protein